MLIDHTKIVARESYTEDWVKFFSDIFKMSQANQDT